jgi:hypothetical protein
MSCWSYSFVTWPQDDGGRLRFRNHQQKYSLSHSNWQKNSQYTSWRKEMNKQKAKGQFLRFITKQGNKRTKCLPAYPMTASAWCLVCLDVLWLCQLNIKNKTANTYEHLRKQNNGFETHSQLWKKNHYRQILRIMIIIQENLQCLRFVIPWVKLFLLWVQWAV